MTYSKILNLNKALMFQIICTIDPYNVIHNCDYKNEYLDTIKLFMFLQGVLPEVDTWPIDFHMLEASLNTQRLIRKTTKQHIIMITFSQYH